MTPAPMAGQCYEVKGFQPVLDLSPLGEGPGERSKNA